MDDVSCPRTSYMAHYSLRMSKDVEVLGHLVDKMGRPMTGSQRVSWDVTGQRVWNEIRVQAFRRN